MYLFNKETRLLKAAGMTQPNALKLRSKVKLNW